MKKLSIVILMTLVIPVQLLAQQALFGGGSIISPEIDDENRVIFRLYAPNATEVKLSGDWMPQEGWTPGSVNLAKGDEGVWEYTTEVMPSDLYTYYFSVDGARVIDPNNVHLVRDVSTIFNLFLIEGGQGDYYKVGDVDHGTVARRWYHSPGNEKDRRISIYTPPGYESSVGNYPVLYLLHGMGGDEEAWLALGRTAQILDNLIAEGKAEPMIVVMPNGNVYQQAAPGESHRGFYQPSFQLPNTMSGEMEETFGDIINFVEENYRVIKEKESRAIAGLSMGGFHSLHTSRYHADTFDYIGLFSPAIVPNENAVSKVYENIDSTLREQMENGYSLYWIAIGKTDFLYSQVENFREKLDQLGMPYVYLETEGGHTWKNWREYLTKFVPLLFDSE